jgi:VIT1/CCC1 family predicted Fe2+/Mn2+ transporter
LSRDLEAERAELAGIYVERGLEPDLAKQVARQLMAKDALGAHARDELGLSEETAARPLQAALASAAAFSLGAVPPLAVALTVAQGLIAPSIALTSVLVLALLGAIGARIGGAKIWVAVVRVTFWGVLAMAVTALIGHLFGARI